MRLETRSHEEEVMHYPDLGCAYSTIDTITTHYLHFDDGAERKQFHARCLNLRPRIKEAIETRKRALQTEYEKELAAYETEKILWAGKSFWSKLWLPLPYLRPKPHIVLSGVEKFITKIETDVDLFYGPINPTVYRAVLKY